VTNQTRGPGDAAASVIRSLAARSVVISLSSHTSSKKGDRRSRNPVSRIDDEDGEEIQGVTGSISKSQFHLVALVVRRPRCVLFGLAAVLGHRYGDSASASGSQHGKRSTVVGFRV
jgi:hypothetical protein